MRSKEIKVNELGRVKGHRAYVTNHEVILEMDPAQCKDFAEHIAQSASGNGITRIVAKWTRRGNDGFDVLVLTTGREAEANAKHTSGYYAKIDMPSVSGTSALAPSYQVQSQPAAQMSDMQQVEYPYPTGTPTNGLN